MAGAEFYRESYGKKMDEKMEASTDPLEKLRHALLKRGRRSGVKMLGRTFRIGDDDGNKKLSLEEFVRVIRGNELPLNEEQIKGLFQRFDADGSGTLDFDEFLKKLQPQLNESRKAVVLNAFAKADRSGDGVITVEDVKGVIDYTHHPKYKNGEWDKDQVLREFIDNFDMPERDGKITKDEFVSYYTSISDGIDNDAYFELMVKNTWKV